MPQSLMEKLQLLFSAKLHDIVNKALQKNPIMVLNEYLREHQDAFNQLAGDLAVTGGRVKTTHRLVQDHQQMVEKLTAEIEAILKDSDATNDYLAQNLATDLVGKEELLANANRTAEAAQRAHTALLTAKSKLEGRIISLRNQIQLLEAIQAEADIKGMTADILIKSARMVSSGVTSVEGLAESIKQNRDKEEARFEMALANLESKGEETLLQTRANTRLDEIRSRLGIKSEEATTEEASLDMAVEELAAIETN